MLLTETKIQESYKITSLVTIGIGLIFIFIPSEYSELTERIWLIMVLNIGFHMVFQLLSRMPFGMYRLFLTQKPNIRTLGTIMLKIWIIVAIAFTILATAFVITIAISGAEYNKLLVLPIFFSVIIGAISSWNKMMAE